MTRCCCTLLGLLVSLVTGCGVGTIVPSAQQGVALQGRVHGGQQPVYQAVLTLYAAGSTGNGTGASNLLGTNVVTTAADGSFSIAGDYTCPSATTQVYLVARGGNPGLAAGTNNAALVMMAALGDCGTLMNTPYVFIDEVTTVAAAWALSPFVSAGAIIGSSATNATGLRNAFLSAQNIVNNATGLGPGAALPAGAVTETAKLYTLANILAPCINSDGAAACGPLFSAAAVGTTPPTDTLDAALHIVSNPGANVLQVYKASSSAGPFQPALGSAPNDWTMSITYGGGGLNQPELLAIDGAGSVWVANYFGAAVSKFSATGVPAAVEGFPGAGLRQSFGVAIDPLGNAWVSNETSVTAANNAHAGSLSEFASNGNELSGFGYTGGGIYYPQGIASDSAGNIWVADYGHSSASLFSNNGNPISSSGGYAPSALPFTSSVAVDAAGSAWFGAQATAGHVTPGGAYASFACCDQAAGVAIDPSGNVWLADYGGASVVELNSLGQVAAHVELNGGLDAPQGIATDSGGHVFTANFRGDSIAELATANAALLSPAAGSGLDAPLNEPLGIAIDASGNLWVSNPGGNTITQFLGLAAPVATPLNGPPIAP